jgi:hypothetical protein
MIQGKNGSGFMAPGDQDRSKLLIFLEADISVQALESSQREEKSQKI